MGTQSLNDFAAVWIKNLWPIFAFMKDKTFKAEQEFRLVTDIDWPSHKGMESEQALEFRHKGNALTWHLPIPFRSVGQSIEGESPLRPPMLLLSHIRIGPTQYAAEAKIGVKQLLQAKGHKGWADNEHKVIVDTSNITYRIF